MTAQLAVVGTRFSEPATDSTSRPVDLSDLALPRSVDEPPSERLLDALERAVREMRIRQRGAPMETDAPLRLGVMMDHELKTVALDLQDIDFQSRADRAAVLDALRDLERQILPS